MMNAIGSRVVVVVLSQSLARLRIRGADNMQNTPEKKLHNLTISDGGLAQTRRTRAELELERALRALFVAMQDRQGRSINQNFRNIASRKTQPWKGIVRRFKEAKRARNDQHNYPLARQVGQAFERYADELYGVDILNDPNNRRRA